MVWSLKRTVSMITSLSLPCFYKRSKKKKKDIVSLVFVPLRSGAGLFLLVLIPVDFKCSLLGSLLPLYGYSLGWVSAVTMMSELRLFASSFQAEIAPLHLPGSHTSPF